jgi:hypothetical protein
MQCPDCGYEADDAAVFCPQCRFQFRNGAEEPAFRDDINEPAPPVDTVMDLPERGFIDDDTIFEEEQKAFSSKELRLLEVQLIQPAILIVLTISLVIYTVIANIPFIPLTVAGISFGVTGIICLAAGLVAGGVFFFIVRRSLWRFRYR